jgi:hypothetical protein
MLSTIVTRVLSCLIFASIFFTAPLTTFCMYLHRILLRPQWLTQSKHNGIMLYQLQQIFITKSGVLTIKNTETETSKNQAWNLLLLKKSYSLSEIQSRCTCRYFTNTRCVTTELMHIMSQNHRCVMLRNATVFLFINVIPKRLFMPSYTQTEIDINPFRSHIGPCPTVWFSSSAPMSEDVRHGFCCVCSPTVGACPTHFLM